MANQCLSGELFTIESRSKKGVQTCQRVLWMSWWYVYWYGQDHICMVLECHRLMMLSKWNSTAYFPFRIVGFLSGSQMPFIYSAFHPLLNEGCEETGE